MLLQVSGGDEVGVGVVDEVVELEFELGEERLEVVEMVLELKVGLEVVELEVELGEAKLEEELEEREVLLTLEREEDETAVVPGDV